MPTLRMNVTTPKPHFWIDVGGTFTDCIALGPEGQIKRHKTLSSGRVKGTIGKGSSRELILDQARATDPADFFSGCRFDLLSGEGYVLESSKIASATDSTHALPLTSPLAAMPTTGTRYEIDSGLEAPLLAIHQLLGIPLREPLPPCSIRLGTTRGTNALLTRTGAKTGFVTTKGLADCLLIGNQSRPQLFALAIEQPPPLATAVAEIAERLAADGSILEAPTPESIRRELQRLRAEGTESLAVCLLHAYRNPVHEELVGRIAREVGFQEISLSHRVSPLIKLVSRGDTTVVDAYLNPVLRSYLDSIGRAIGQETNQAADLRVLTSAGGLASREAFSGKDSILSGPAGGVVGFSRVAQAAGFTRAIGFDMGGTSTDVARFDGTYEKEYETEKAGVRIVAPMLSIETVAAGGGSLCQFDGMRLTVGPASAGADPGPACYGRGGPLTVTDMNFFLGKISTDHFPFPLDRASVERKLEALCEQIEREASTHYTSHSLAEGFLQVANTHMAAAIRSISVAKGYDVRDYPLVAFGGAAPQHACAVARELGMREVLNHPDGGVLSAYGMGLADVTRHAVEGIYREYEATLLPRLQDVFDHLIQRVTREVRAEGIEPEQIEATCSLELRYQGIDSTLIVPQPDDHDWLAAYEAQHRQLYGYVHADRAVEVVAVRVEGIGRGEQAPPLAEKLPRIEAASTETVEVFFQEAFHRTPVYQRGDLQGGELLEGPALVLEQVSTTLVDPGWQAEVLSGGVLSGGVLLLTDCCGPTDETIDTAFDPIRLEVFNNHFTAIATQMGVTLRNTASSVNVKERLDFSCAIFTSTGELVVNAPHIPVHLGAMGETVRRAIADNAELQPGDSIVTNDPYRGGSHLPDVTVITPVHNEQGRLMFFTASRAHHAEIGGISPGSMPPFSRNLAEEGVLIRNFKLIAAGESRFGELEQLLTAAEYPSRKPSDNLADIAAQLAANRQGMRDLLTMVDRYSLEVVEAYMAYIQQAAEQKTRAALARLPAGIRRFTDHLDDGTPISVQIEITGEQATIDFTGTGGVMPGNLNANRAIVTAAVLYCLRLLIDEPIPLNQGVLAPVTLVLPECLLNPPEHESPADCAAIVGGNVETSQRVVDVLLGALQLAAASGGTMNNTLFGNDSFGYYETIGGGAGATEGHQGASAVHTHMTNTRLTDPEVLESQFPVRLREFSIRHGSGGAGRFSGGDGIVRRIEFLEPLRLSILSQRRGEFAPYGVDGGEPGARGENQLIRADGEIMRLEGLAQVEVNRGDRLSIKTPGGGGWGQR